MRINLAHRITFVAMLLTWGCTDVSEPDTHDLDQGAAIESSDELEQQAALELSTARNRRCGGPFGLRCDSADFCSIPSVSGSCPSPKAYGVCQPRPTRLCPQVFDPVCGCDGKTYSNACSAAAAGVSVRSAGECLPSGPVCGGFLGLVCPGEGACVDEPSDDCDPKAGGADCSGICECRDPHSCPQGSRFDPRPEVCACVRAPVLCPTAPCTFTDCAAGSRCVERDCQAVCEPIGGGCAPCPSGELCTDVCLPFPAPTE